MFMSMTGYGRSQQTIKELDILVEIKSVNHRYYEASVRCPRAYGYVEEHVKSRVATRVSRGKLDISIIINSSNGKESQVQINRSLAAGYLVALKSLGNELYIDDDVKVSTLSRFSDIFTVVSVAEDEDEIIAAVLLVLDTALERFVEMRRNEGERLLEDVSKRLLMIEGVVAEIELISPKTIKDYKDRLFNKLSELLENKNVDEARVLTEVAIFAEKIAVDEETVRLRSHIAQFAKLLRSKEAVGRKLDFLLQEMNREINTIGSKCQDVAVTNLVIDVKSELEKIREQIQNIE